MAKKPILYDPDKPLAHYTQAWKLYKKARFWLEFGFIMPIAALLPGVASILYDPLHMALFALFAVPFTLLALIGCKTRRAIMCLISVPLAVVAALVAVLSDAFFGPLGFAAYLVSAFAEFRAISAISNFAMLKELPGFPFFDPSMDDLTFAALDVHGADEFVEGDLKTEKTVMRFKPEELEPSEEMEEIVTGVSLKKEEPPTVQPSTVEPSEVDQAPKDEPPKLRPIEAGREESKFEKMMKAKPQSNNEISDIDLFG